MAEYRGNVKKGFVKNSTNAENRKRNPKFFCCMNCNNASAMCEKNCIKVMDEQQKIFAINFQKQLTSQPSYGRI